MFFHSLSCVLSFDWHSSGTTTTTCGALKEALSEDMGIIACGGKGKASRKTPEEIRMHSDHFSISESKRNALLSASLLSAKVDNSCIQDNYNLYHHSFFFDEKGSWTVIQQGMNNANRYARRYHWLETCNFTEAPPENIAGIKSIEGETLNLVGEESAEMRGHSVGLINDNPNRLRKYLNGQTTLFDQEMHSLPERHEILKCDMSKKDWEILQNAYEIQPKNYCELISLHGMGKKKLRALALVSKLIYGNKLDWKDPVKYSFAHGGKDGIPYPVDKSSYDHSIRFLFNVIQSSELKDTERKNALKTLSLITASYQ